MTHLRGHLSELRVSGAERLHFLQQDRATEHLTSMKNRARSTQPTTLLIATGLLTAGVLLLAIPAVAHEQATGSRTRGAPSEESEPADTDDEEKTTPREKTPEAGARKKPAGGGEHEHPQQRSPGGSQSGSGSYSAPPRGYE